MTILSKLTMLAVSVLAMACSSASKASDSASVPEGAAAAKPAAPAFCADSAYAFVEAQVAMGPRVPGSKASEQCGDWIVEKLRQYGAANIAEQRAEVRNYLGQPMPLRNISAQFNPAASKRVLLAAHWDSRPWADQEPNAADRERPIDGANDGASGAGVLLEMARLMAQTAPNVGVDLLFLDAEDSGRRADAPAESADNSWCLGAQHWALEPTLDCSKIRYGLLLDMVGGRGATFPREYFSQKIAKHINDKVWQAAREAGLASRFPDTEGGAIVDDHIYLSRLGFPVVDIIESANPDTGSFPPYWHTHADDMTQIDRATLGDVGTVVARLIYSE